MTIFPPGFIRPTNSKCHALPNPFLTGSTWAPALVQLHPDRSLATLSAQALHGGAGRGVGEKAKGSKAPDRLTVADDGRAGAGGQIVRPRASPCLSPAAAAASPRKCACVANIRTGRQYGRGRTRCLSAANALGRCYNSLGGSAGSERATADSFSSALPCRRLSLPPSLPRQLDRPLSLHSIEH